MVALFRCLLFFFFFVNSTLDEQQWRKICEEIIFLHKKAENEYERRRRAFFFRLLCVATFAVLLLMGGAYLMWQVSSWDNIDLLECKKKMNRWKHLLSKVFLLAIQELLSYRYLCIGIYRKTLNSTNIVRGRFKQVLLYVFTLYAYGFQMVFNLLFIHFIQEGEINCASKITKMVFKTDYRLMQFKSIAECSKGMLQREHSAILSTFNMLTVVD